jgi:RNA polymerase sigma factor (sigma-70 family)
LQYCLVREGYVPFLVGVVLRLFDTLSELFSARLLAVAENADEIQCAVSRESISQQAERLLINHGDAALRMAYSYLHSMEDAEEILQDTLVQFLKAAPILESREHEKAWFLHVAANLCRNRLKYNAVRQTDELADDLQAEGRSDLLFVWDAVKSLPEKYREVVHLYYYEGYQTAEIARMLEIKEATVRSNLARGREKLKSVLKEAYDFG